MKKKELLLGAHMSITGGFEQSIIRAESISCTALQIFTKSNRQWKAKPISKEQADLFKKTLQSSSIRSVMAHSSYLINIGSTNKALAEKSVAALIEELQRCHDLGIPYLILHPGASGTSTHEESLALVSHLLNYAFEHTPSDTMILLENTAGQGSTLGSTFEQLRIIYNEVLDKKRLGFCFDTCHAFAAGYDFSTPEKYKSVWDDFDNNLGLDNLKAMHMNDSLKAAGSHIDRHTHIGQGQIGIEGFRLLMNDPRFFAIPKVLETPKKSDNLEEDSKNLEILKNLLMEK